MACIDGLDPNDFESGVLDPSSDPSPDNPRFDISDGVFYDVASPYVQFEVTPTPIKYTAGISVLWSTVNGTAIGGTHFTAVSSQLLSFASGEGTKQIQVSVLTPAGVSGAKSFTINLSGNSAGTTIGDGTGAGTIYYQGSTPPPSTDPADLASYTGWPDDFTTVYNQFNACPNSACTYRCGGCNYYGACTGFAGAAATSVTRYRDKGDAQCYDAKALYTAAGGPGADATCSGGGWHSTKVLDYMRDTGALLGGSSSTRWRIASWSQIYDSTKSELIKKLKRSIYNNGCVYMDSIFYSDWNNPPSSNVLQDHGSGTSSAGHSWILVGWNNNVSGGSFLVQSSHGVSWGNHGRCWIPYSYLKTAGTTPNPWYRYYSVVPKAGG